LIVWTTRQSTHLFGIALALLTLIALPAPAGAAPASGKRPRVRTTTRGKRVVRRHGLRVRARARLARRTLSRTARSALLSLGVKLGELKKRAAGTRMGKGTIRLRHRAGQITLAVSASLTAAGDALEAGLGPVGARRVHTLRAFNPLAIAAFAVNKIRKDPWFFATYGTFSLALSLGSMPAMLALGVPPAIATTLPLGPPVDLVAVTLREHFRRKDRSRSFWGTLGSLRREYTAFGQERRKKNRTFIYGDAARGFISHGEPGPTSATPTPASALRTYGL
jgi:hypothetical protein